MFDFPRQHRRRLRTANGMKRLNREVRRRSRVTILFTNVASCERLVTAMLMEISEEWETSRIYLRLEDDESSLSIVKMREKPSSGLRVCGQLVAGGNVVADQTVGPYPSAHLLAN